jgi:hypothetical protein
VVDVGIQHQTTRKFIVLILSCVLIHSLASAQYFASSLFQRSSYRTGLKRRIILQPPSFFVAGQTQLENSSPNRPPPISNRKEKTHPTKNTHSLQATTDNPKNPPLARFGVWPAMIPFLIQNKNLKGKRLIF